MLDRFELFSSSISGISRHIQKIERIEMEKFGLKGPHVQCLLALNKYPDGLTVSQLCGQCEKDKAAISRTVAELETENMVVRHTNNGNRYRAVLQLTPLGKEAADRVNQRVKVAVEKAGEGLTEDQRSNLYIALTLISGNLQAMSEYGIAEE